MCLCFYGLSRFPCEGPALFGAFAGERWPWHSRPQQQTLSEHDHAGSGNVPQSHIILVCQESESVFSEDPKQDWQDALRKHELLG